MMRGRGRGRLLVVLVVVVPAPRLSEPAAQHPRELPPHIGAAVEDEAAEGGRHVLFHQLGHGVVPHRHQGRQGLQGQRADAGVLVGQVAQQGPEQRGLVQAQLGRGVAGGEPQRRAGLALGVGEGVG